MTKEAREPASSAAEVGGTRIRAIILWVLVVIALLYGVVATAVKIPALFG